MPSALLLIASARVLPAPPLSSEGSSIARRAEVPCCTAALLAGAADGEQVTFAMYDSLILARRARELPNAERNGALHATCDRGDTREGPKVG